MSDSEISNKSGLAQAFEIWVVTLNNIGTAWIFLLMLIINADVLARFLFNAPIDGVPEMVSLSIVGIVFLQLGDAVRSGRLTRSDAFLNKINRQKPRLGSALNIFYDICGAAFFIAILFGAIPMLTEAYKGGFYAGTEGVFTVTEWPIRLVFVVSCITVVAVFLVLVKRHVSALVHPKVSEQ